MTADCISSRSSSTSSSSSSPGRHAVQAITSKVQFIKGSFILCETGQREPIRYDSFGFGGFYERDLAAERRERKLNHQSGSIFFLALPRSARRLNKPRTIGAIHFKNRGIDDHHWGSWNFISQVWLCRWVRMMELSIFLLRKNTKSVKLEALLFENWTEKFNFNFQNKHPLVFFFQKRWHHYHFAPNGSQFMASEPFTTCLCCFPLNPRGANFCGGASINNFPISRRHFYSFCWLAGWMREPSFKPLSGNKKNTKKCSKKY